MSMLSMTGSGEAGANGGSVVMTAPGTPSTNGSVGMSAPHTPVNGVGVGGGVVMATAPHTPVTQEEYIAPTTPTGVGTVGTFEEFEGDPENFDIGSGGDIDSFHDADKVGNPFDKTAPPPPPPPNASPPPPHDSVEQEEGRPRVDTHPDDVVKAEELL